MDRLRSRRLALVEGLSLASLGFVSGFMSRAQAGPGDKHPHMHAAIRELREAKKELEQAPHDYGHLGKDAIKAIDHAIEHLGKWLEAANKK